MNTKKENKENKIMYTPEVKREKALSYLKEKYNEEFVATAMSGSGWGQAQDEIYIHPKNGTKEDTFAVWGVIRDDGTYSMHDGYFGVIIHDEYQAVLSGFVKYTYKDFKLNTTFGSGIVFPDRFNKNTKISEIYNKNEVFTSDTDLFVKKGSTKGIDTDESLKKIALKMKEEKLPCEITIYIVYDDKYENASLSTLMKEEGEDYFTNDSRKYIWIGRNLELSEVEHA